MHWRIIHYNGMNILKLGQRFMLICFYNSKNNSFWNNHESHYDSIMQIL